MVRVVYEVEACRVRVEGHAGAGEFGRDPVCAAVSALCLTLAENGSALGGQAVLEPGRAEICCPGAEAAFEAVCRGFAWLAREFPEYVSYTREGEFTGATSIEIVGADAPAAIL